MKRKGFTLIELLAVIVIIVIILLISIPVILGIIEKSKKGAAEASALGYIDAVEKQVGVSYIDSDIEDIIEGTYTIEDLNNHQVEVKGDKPSSGEVIINEKKQVSKATLCINKYKVEYENGKAKATNSSECSGVIEEEIINEELEIWDGWVTMSLYYPENATNKRWRIGEVGETKFEESLRWNSYTGPITIRLKDVENVWISYEIDGNQTVVAPSGVLAVDIEADSYAPTLKDKVKIKIYYDNSAEIKEYKIGNSGWLTYTGEFYVSENTIVEARAKKIEKISDSDGNIIGEKEIWGRDNLYVGNIGIEVADLEAPTIKRKARDQSVQGEVAKIEINYPEGAVKKIYKTNYGEEVEYKSELSIKEYGTHVIAYYYDSKGKRSKAKEIIINEDVTNETDYTPNNPGGPGSSGGGSNGSNPTSPSYVVLAPTINITPTSITDKVNVSISVPSGYIASSIYYKIGDGNYQTYNGSFEITKNTIITAYYVTVKGEKSSIGYRRLSNIKEGSLPYIGIIANPDSYSKKYDVKKVEVTIQSEDAQTVEYSLNGIEYKEYTVPFEVTKNTRVYARGINSVGERTEYIDITNIGNKAPVNEKLGVSIEVNPEPSGATEIYEKAKVTINYDARASKKYYRINNGELKEYKGVFEVDENCTITGYAVSESGKGEASKQIDHLQKGISKPIIRANPGNGTRAGKTIITIDYDKTATTKRYRLGTGSLIDYTGPIEITENTTITAYNKNKLGYEATNSYEITNIVKTNVVVIDKGKYYLLKLNYPERANNKEYKWQDDGVWKSYPADGILLVKPEYKNEIIGSVIKIENENGKEVIFKGDYYFVTGSVTELLEHVYMRWDRTAPGAPTIILNTEEPTREVSVVINYPKSHIKKEVKIVNSDGSSDGFKEYTGAIKIKDKGTVIYARGMDSAEVWSNTVVKKITNIDSEAPYIKVTADLENIAQKVGIKVEVTDDVRVGTIKWDKGIRGESYFEGNGKVIPNNSVFYVTENGYYTVYSEDSVGNKSTYTVNVENIDSEAPIVNITVAPNDTITTTVKINIDYGDSSLKQYKIGTSNNTWTTYTGEITLTSNTVIANNWKNSDLTVTVYAKGKDKAGNEQIVAYKILSLDLDMPTTPVITSNYSYPMLTEYGVEFDGETSISYDERAGIKNYYSTDNGATWKEYTGEFKVTTIGTVIAKSVKASGLEVIASKAITMPSDALGIAAYDGNTGTYVRGDDTNPKYIEIDSGMWEKKVTLQFSGSGRIGFYNSSGTQLALYTITGNISYVIPKETKKMALYKNYGSTAGDLYEIYTNNIPVINNTKYYPTLTEYGIEAGYNEVTIDYFQTSVQRLYKIGTGEWQNYQDKKIRLEIGQVIYAKGIDKNGKETYSIISYTSALSSDTLGAKAYDGNTSTYVRGDDTIPQYIEIDSAMWEKKVSLQFSGSGRIGFYNSSGTQLALYTITGNISYVIPKETKKMALYKNYGSTAGDLYEIVINNSPAIESDENYDVTITYNSTANTRLYKIDNGDWKSYQDKKIKLEIGQTIYAKDISKNGKESSIASKSFTYSALIPKLTSNTGSNGKVTVSSKYGDSWDGWIAFNERSSGDGWYATASPAWIQYQFNNPTLINKIYIYATSGSSGSNTSVLSFQYSNDGINYYDVLTNYTYTVGNTTTINIDNKLFAKYWRLNFTKALRVYNLQFYGI